MARDALIEGMDDGVMVLDTQCRLVDLNPAAQRLAAPAAPWVAGRPLTAAFSDLAALDRECREAGEGALQAALARVLPANLEVRVSLLHGQSGEAAGYLVVLRDVSERRRAEAERDRLIAELRTLLSQVKTLSGLLPICASCKRIRDDQGYWRQIEVYISERSQAEFSHGLCPDCLRSLYGHYGEPAHPSTPSAPPEPDSATGAP